jgi:hypothetical protein
MTSGIVRGLCTTVVAGILFTSVALAGDGLVALQTADASCGNNAPKTYVSCVNGTVTDNRTGLVWLGNANCWGPLTWADAMATVAGLGDLPGSNQDDCGLSDGSSPGEWRLATKAEWSAMVAYALGCDPKITDDQGGTCWSDVAGTQWTSFSGVQSLSYWSSTTLASAPTNARTLHLGDPPVIDLTFASKTAIRRVWPVRGGQ